MELRFFLASKFSHTIVACLAGRMCLTEGLDENDLTERLGPKSQMTKERQGEIILGQDFGLPRSLKKPAVVKHLHQERCRIVRATFHSFPKFKVT